jgi:hypothetical protein
MREDRPHHCGRNPGKRQTPVPPAGGGLPNTDGDAGKAQQKGIRPRLKGRKKRKPAPKKNAHCEEAEDGAGVSSDEKIDHQRGDIYRGDRRKT